MKKFDKIHSVKSKLGAVSVITGDFGISEFNEMIEEGYEGRISCRCCGNVHDAKDAKCSVCGLKVKLKKGGFQNDYI